MFITWKISRLVSLDRYVADVGFHHVDSLDAGAKHTVILEPNGNYEYSIEQKGSIALPAPYDTNCVDYKMFGLHRFYGAYMTQTAVCAAFCLMQAHTDILQYESYPTAVMYGHDRMLGIEFPAVTLCMEKGWQPSYTHAFETVCHTFDLARNRSGQHPYWSCPSPWKYKMLASVSARSERSDNESVFLMGHFHQQHVIGNGERSTMKFRAGYKYKIATYQTNSHSLPYPYETMCSDYVTLSKELGYKGYIMQSEVIKGRKVYASQG
ncbi:hypothetical protein V5799_008679 [Amblyomma americanum]|uniref:Uncharacterized protein n=1 Tax=Amblyomma americanum TaxID=6943 RepID=A0AAQ4FCB6_AMBAM